MRVHAMILITALLPAGVAAQSGKTEPEAPRAWIRQTTERNVLDQGIKGSVVRIAADTIFLRPKGRLEPLPLLVTERTRIQLPQGTKSGVGRGTRIGAGVGAGAGLLLVLFAGGGSSVGPGGAVGSGGVVILIPVVVGMIGAGIGAIAGSASTVEAWSSPMSIMGAMPTLSRVPGAR